MVLKPSRRVMFTLAVALQGGRTGGEDDSTAVVGHVRGPLHSHALAHPAELAVALDRLGADEEVGAVDQDCMPAQGVRQFSRHMSQHSLAKCTMESLQQAETHV